MGNLRKGSLASLLLIVEQATLKLVGLLSTLILARLLLPEDFGIIAIAMLVMGFLDILINTGSGQYLLRVDKLDDDKINTSWTINFILRTAISVIMFASAFFIADYYSDPRLIDIISTLALISLTYNFCNPGLAYLYREQEYSRIVKLRVITKLFSAIATVIAAIVLQNYWALIIGRGVSAILQLFGEYIVFPYRPKFHLSNAKEQWKFSGWMMPQSVFGYFRTQLDSLLVSSSYGQAALGSYHTIKYVAFIPNEYFLTPLTGPFMVELAKARVDKNYFNKQYNVSLLLVMLLAVPITSIMYMYHDLITLLLLGPNWIEFSYLLGIFSLLLPTSVIQQHYSRCLILFGKTKELFFAQLITFICVFPPLYFIGIKDLSAFGWFRVLAEFFAAILFLLVTSIVYTGGKNTARLCVAFIPILSSLFFSVFATKTVGRLGVNVFVDLTVVSFVFLITFISAMLIQHFLILRKTTDWQYMESLIIRLLEPVLNKFKSI
jgi:lipopolysaccharide exporter